MPLLPLLQAVAPSTEANSIDWFARLRLPVATIDERIQTNVWLMASQYRKLVASPECDRVFGACILSVSATSTSCKLVSHDGCRLQVHRWGSSGPACIFLHGFGEGGYIWDDFASTILPNYQSIVVDLRGHGDSEWDVSRRYESESHVRDIEFVIDRLDLKRVAIVGHSLGGSIGIRIAAARPETVFAAVIVEAGPALRKESLARIYADFRESHRIYTTIDEYADWLERRRVLVSRKKLRVLANRSLRHRSDGRFELKADLRIADSVGHPDADAALWAAVAEVDCPTLLLRGAASSVLAHDTATEIASAFSKAQLRTINRAGHGLIVENPIAFAEVVRSFLDEAVIGIAAKRENRTISRSAVASVVRADERQPG